MPPLFTKALIGMVHIGALPGTPHAREPISKLAKQAASEAQILADAGFDAVMIENMHDAPYINTHGPEITAAMTAIGLAVASACKDIPLGIQVLSSGSREALAIALAIGARFIRVENFVFSHVADEGLMPDAVAGPLLRYRRQIGATRVAILADIKKKHASHAITADVPIEDAAHAAEFFGADGLIVTGAFTGRAASTADLKAVRTATKLPVVVGSGVTPKNLAAMFTHADAVIVGSHLKRDGHWSQPVDPKRAAQMVSTASKEKGSE